MANKVLLEITVKGNNEIVEITQQTEKLNKATKDTARNSRSAAAEQDKLLKQGAGNSKNATANFAKQAQGMGGLVHIYATVAANVWALSAAFDVLKRNADLTIMAESARDLSRSTGMSFAQVARDMQKITGGAINFTDAMRQANLALSGGATINQVKEITSIANKAANALGLSVPNAVSRMIQAVTKGEPELVDELGIILRVTKATEDYAAKLGINATQLTTFQKQQAIINQLIDQGNDKFRDVEKRTNPYARLTASVTELSVKVIELGSKGLAPFVELITNSTPLIVAGFALIAKSLIGLILPTLILTGQEAEKMAAENAKAAQKSTLEYEGMGKELDIVSKKLQRLTKISNKQANASSSGAALEEIAGSGALFKNLNKKSGLGREFRTIVERGANKGLSEADLLKQVKDSKVIERLQTAIEKEDLSIFKKGTSSEIFEAAKDDLADVQAIFNNAHKQEKLVEDSRKLRHKQRTARMREIHALTAQSLAQGRVQILQSDQIGLTYKATRVAIANLGAEYNRAVVSQSFFTRGMLRAQQAARSTQLAFSGIGHAVGQMVNKGFGAATTLLLLWEGLKIGVGWLDLTSEKFKESARSITETSEALRDAKKDYGDISDVLAEMPADLTEVVQKWKKLNGVADQYVTLLEKLSVAMVGISQETWWDKLLSWDWSKSEEGAKNFVELLEGLSNTIGEEINFEVNIPRLDMAQRKRIKELESPFEKTRQIGKGNKAGIERYFDFSSMSDKVKEELKEIRDNPTGIKIPVSSLMEKIKLEEIFNIKGFAEALEKQGPSRFEELLAEFKEINVMIDTVVTAISKIDREINSLHQKSESRRIFNVDSLMTFRDGLKDISVGLAGLDKTKAADSIKALFEGTSQTFRDVFLPTIKEGMPKEELISIMEKALGGLDKDIDLIRNLATNLKILGIEMRGFKADKDRGHLDNLFDIYDLEKKTLAAQIEAKEAQVRTEKKQRTLFQQDVGYRSASLSLLETELAALVEKDRRLKAGIPLVEHELASLARSVALEKKRVAIVKELSKSLSLQRSLGAQFAVLSARNVVTLREQKQLVAQSTQDEINKLINAGRELKKRAELTKLQEGYLSQEELALELSNLRFKEDNLRITQLQEELKLTKEIFAANNLARGQIGQTGYANSFAGLFDSNFWSDASTKFGLIANDMALKIGNSINNVTGIIVGGIEKVTDSTINRIISNEWDGKEEGKSFSHAMREGLKTTLRESIGTSIKENMNQAIVKLLSLGDKQIPVMVQQITQLQANTSALWGVRAALVTKQSGGVFESLSNGMFRNNGLLVNNPTSSSTLSTATHHFAKGGLVSKPTIATIGEGRQVEAVVPLPDNRSIPVSIEGDTGDTINVNQSFDFRGADATTEAKLRQFAAQIKRETTKEIFDSINRGGSAAKIVGRR